MIKRQGEGRREAFDLPTHAVGITEANLSLLKSGKVKGVRFGTLDAICRHINCQPGDLLEYEPDEEHEQLAADELRHHFAHLVPLTERPLLGHGRAPRYV